MEIFLLLSFLLLLGVLIFMYLYFIVSSEDPLLKYYYISNNKVFAQQDLPEFTDLGVVSVHNEGLSRLKNIENNETFETSQNIKWRKHRLIGKHFNHSNDPNCEVYKSSPLTFGLRTVKPIKMNEEITADYYPLQRFYE